MTRQAHGLWEDSDIQCYLTQMSLLHITGSNSFPTNWAKLGMEHNLTTFRISFIFTISVYHSSFHICQSPAFNRNFIFTAKDNNLIILSLYNMNSQYPIHKANTHMNLFQPIYLDYETQISILLRGVKATIQFSIGQNTNENKIHFN